MPIIKLDKDKLSNIRKIGMPSLQARLHQAQEKRNSTPPKVFTHRILLMLDISSSMQWEEDGKPKIDHLRDALHYFAESVNSDDTSVAAITIPLSPELEQQPSNEPAVLMFYASRLATQGNTPLGETMQHGLASFSIARGIIISDGEKTDGESCFSVATDYAEAGIQVDCVHIGRSAEGEETLKRIADITHGLYIKFDNVANFSKAFKFLTPALRGMLTSGNAAELLGAKEVR